MSLSTLLTCLGIGILAGVIAALCGVGGGVVMVPAFVSLLAMPQKTAVATSLAIIIPTALMATTQNAKNGFVDWKVAAVTALSASIFAYFGADWMKTQLPRHAVFVSSEVHLELNHPAFKQRESAARLIESLPLLKLTPEVLGLAEILVREKVMPSPATGDAVHVAAACVHQMDYLLSWNIRHLANRNKVVHLQTVCARLSILPPQIVTPEILWENTP